MSQIRFTGGGGRAARAEDASAARLPLARVGRWPGRRFPLVGAGLEPPEDAGPLEEPAQQERPHPDLRLAR